MFKKIEIWILYLVVFLGIPLTIGFGGLVRQELVGENKLGWVSKGSLFLSSLPTKFFTVATKFEPNRIENDRFPDLSGFIGNFNSKENYLLLSRYDGDLKEGVVELVDLRNFKVLHSWNPDLSKLNKLIPNINEFLFLDRDIKEYRTLFKSPILTKDKGLLINDGVLRKVDYCSNLIFQNENEFFHHSIETDIDGNIWVPSHMFPKSLSVKKVGNQPANAGGYFDDSIVKLSSNGKILFQKSVSQIFIDNGLEYLLFSVGDPKFDFDPIHLNDIQPINYDGKYWKKGDVFLSLRHQSMVLLYRPSTNKIIWKGTGPFFHQHDVNVLNDHSISIFNNNSKIFINGDEVEGHNEVIVYDFKTNQYSQYLKESLSKNDVKTVSQGRSTILPNGDLFVEEQNYGRILYFNSDGSLRWTHINRAENGNLYANSWSRILFDKKDIKIVNNFLQAEAKCDK